MLMKNEGGASMSRRGATRGSIIVVVGLVLGLVVGLAPTTAGAARPTASKPTGDPVKLMVAGDWTFPDGSKDETGPAGAEAAAKAINKAGGIQGHPVETIVCDSANDPNKAEECAREAVDEGVVAFVGLAMNQTEEPRVFPILEEAGIPVIAAVGQGASSLTSDLSFVVGNGTPGLFQGMGQVLTETTGATRLAFVVSDLGAAAETFFRLFLDPGLKLAGAELVGDPVRVPVDATDMAPYVASTTKDDPDGVLSFITGESGANFVAELRRSGYDKPVAVAPGLMSEELLGELGDAAKGLYGFSAFNAVTNKAPGYRQYRKDMKAIGAPVELAERSINAWLGVQVFEQLARDLATIDAPSVLAAMGQVADMDMGGITPPLTTTEPAVADSPLLARIFNGTGVFVVAKGGRWKRSPTTKTFFDVFTGEPTEVRAAG
jgi:ABC-type branched-subunit amino acid transport system substrate-binding protein